MSLPAADRTVLEALAGDVSAGASALRARIVLACTTLPTDAAVAAQLEVDARTVGKWRRRYTRLGVAGLDEAAAGHAPAAAGEQALLTPLTGSPSGGGSWTSRSVAAATGLSQSTVARIWRAAGFRPPPPDVLVADPLLRGRPRLLAGIHVAARPHTAGGGAAGPGRPAPHLAVAFWVDHSPATPRGRTREDDEGAAVSAAARSAAWDAATNLCHAARHLAERLPEPAEACCGGEFVEFLRDLAARRPAGTHLWVLLGHPPSAAVARWARGQHPAIQLGHTPSTTAWTAVAARSVAATALTLAARELPSPVAVAAAHLRHRTYDHTAGTASWRNPEAELDAVFARLRRPVLRPPRHAVTVPNVWEAMAGLRRRRPPTFTADLPAFEQLVHFRRRSADARLVREDYVDAMVVLADLQTTRDLAEHALIRFCRAVWAPPRQIAQRLGVTTLHAVGQRYRRLARPGGRSNTSTAGATRRTHVGADGQVHDVVEETLTQLHDRWVADLADHEHRIERLPGTQDVFAALAYIIDTTRPVPHLADPAQPSPMERRQADGLAGLTVVVDLRHRLAWERLCWYRLAQQAGVPLRELGAPFGRSPAAVIKDRHRLHQRFTGDPDATTTQPSARHDYWSDHDTAVHAAITALLEHRDVFADDEDLVFWLDELAEAVDRPDPPVGLFIGLVHELCQDRDCASCATPRIPVIRDATNRATCTTCADRAALAELVERAAGLAGVPVDQHT